MMHSISRYKLKVVQSIFSLMLFMCFSLISLPIHVQAVPLNIFDSGGGGIMRLMWEF